MRNSEKEKELLMEKSSFPDFFVVHKLSLRKVALQQSPRPFHLLNAKLRTAAKQALQTPK
jgi:hypothetical protein